MQWATISGLDNTTIVTAAIFSILGKRMQLQFHNTESYQDLIC